MKTYKDYCEKKKRENKFSRFRPDFYEAAKAACEAEGYSLEYPWWRKGGRRGLVELEELMEVYVYGKGVKKSRLPVVEGETFYLMPSPEFSHSPLGSFCREGFLTEEGKRTGEKYRVASVLGGMVLFEKV